MNQKTLLIAAAMAVTFVLGFVLSRSGRPYSGLVMNIHKLVSLAGFVIWIMAVFQLRRDIGLTTAQVTVMILSAVLFLATVATGGILSAMNQPPAIAKTLHAVGPWGVLITGGYSLLHPLLST